MEESKEPKEKGDDIRAIREAAKLAARDDQEKPFSWIAHGFELRRVSTFNMKHASLDIIQRAIPIDFAGYQIKVLPGAAHCEVRREKDEFRVIVWECDAFSYFDYAYRFVIYECTVKRKPPTRICQPA